LITAETLRMKGDLLILTDNRISAEASFRDAIALARRQEAKLWELRASTSLARLWRDLHPTVLPSWFHIVTVIGAVKPADRRAAGRYCGTPSMA
jgi:hypothetical protein